MAFGSFLVGCRVSSSRQDQIQSIFPLLFTHSRLLSILRCNPLPTLNHFFFLHQFAIFSLPPSRYAACYYIFQRMVRCPLSKRSLTDGHMVFLHHLLLQEDAAKLNILVHVPPMCRSAGEGNSQVQVDHHRYGHLQAEWLLPTLSIWSLYPFVFPTATCEALLTCVGTCANLLG